MVPVSTRLMAALLAGVIGAGVFAPTNAAAPAAVAWVSGGLMASDGDCDDKKLWPGESAKDPCEGKKKGTER